MSAESEAIAAARLAASLHSLLQEALHNLTPEWIAGVVEEELLRLRTAEIAPVAEWPAEWNGLLQESFAPQIEQIARRLVQAEVKKALPVVAERLVQEELQRL
ncbi:hypothetical protein [Candidatus Magnetaquicoccus inordinatus]|uniref:hypothetical protein n=1 Tax=Candidatus Magnetaquicoccus inordinatus TaxID=2496818 RepID=UPI00102BADC6|nr:hypothetical protein [Candidatus Magnetaquicoccus inordinatus]